jgi:DDE superfamily endonuclease
MAKLSEWTASQLVFIDESTANERTLDYRYGWAPIGISSIEKRSIQYSVRWLILPAYSIHSYIVWDLLQGSYTAETFEIFIQEKVLPLCNPFSGPQSIIIIDNTRIHRPQV